MSWGFNLKVSEKDLVNVSVRLRGLSDFSDQVAANTVMQVADAVMTQAIADITDEINVSTAYVREKFRLVRENNGRGAAVISARWRPMNLFRFDARQLTEPTVNSRRSKGDSMRGIPPGRKAAGFSVKEWRRGGRNVIPGAFSLPMRAGKVDGGNGLGLFIREPGGGFRTMYGPSPAQMFRAWRTKNAPDIKRQLAETYAQNLRAYLAKK